MSTNASVASATPNRAIIGNESVGTTAVTAGIVGVGLGPTKPENWTVRLMVVTAPGFTGRARHWRAAPLSRHPAVTVFWRLSAPIWDQTELKPFAAYESAAVLGMNWIVYVWVVPQF